jgi:penicillin-binding protein 2
MSKRTRDVAFEDALHDDWSRDADLLEVPIGRRPLVYVGMVVAVLAFAIAGRVIFLNAMDGGYDRACAAANAAASSATPAPRGLIYDREGNVLAENQAAFAALLDTRTFLRDTSDQSGTLAAVQDILGIPPDAVWSLAGEASKEDFAVPIVLSENVTQNQLVRLQALALPAIQIQSHFERTYPEGDAFSTVLGYTGRPTQDDLTAHPTLQTGDSVGKAGLEAFYDQSLRGTPGKSATFRNAQGEALGDAVNTDPKIGTPLHLTLDGGLQKYFYNRLQVGLQSLGRTTGLGIAMDPQTGEILSLVNLPGYNNNVFSSGTSAEISQLLTSPSEPLFDRAVAGSYNPGSTIKPLDAVAALKEGVITPDRTIYSPGYLLVPNPYNSSTPSRYLDWQPQGFVDIKSAIAQSSDVYFYIVGGGSPLAHPALNDPSDYGISGLGIDRLYKWWQTFGLGTSTGIDLPGENTGFLPTVAWKEKRMGTPWLLGDTYNVSIGQGDLMLTPLQLIDYIAAIANGGKLYRPFLNASSSPALRTDLTSLLPQIQVVQQGMRQAVTSPRGTAYTMDDLPFPSCAKTGSAQVKNNTQENALFVGYASCDNPQIVLLILIENSREGSLNAVPIAKDVLNWYYENRMNKQ